MTTCGEIMIRDPICCLPRDNVEHIAQLMKQHNLDEIPVVTSYFANKLVGLVTYRDLALGVVAKGRSPRLTPVKTILTAYPRVCNPDDSVTVVIGIMAWRQVHRLPVVDTLGRLVGIIMLEDIATLTEDAQQPANVLT